MNKLDITTTFLTGCGHTGTTIISRILGEHSRIYFPLYETNCFLLYNHFKTKEILDDFKSKASINNCTHLLEKTPRHIWHIDWIKREYSDSNFILTTRKARDVIASLFKRQTVQNRDSLKHAINRYKDESILTIRQLNNKNTLLVKYEDFVENPAAEIKRNLKFLNLEFESSMLDYHLNQVNWNHQTQIIRSNGKGEIKHDQLRNFQVNSKIFKPVITWKEIIPERYWKTIDAFMEEFGNEIMSRLGY
jgi:protein O-GlcNAc transferase